MNNPRRTLSLLALGAVITLSSGNAMQASENKKSEWRIVNVFMSLKNGIASFIPTSGNRDAATASLPTELQQSVTPAEKEAAEQSLPGSVDTPPTDSLYLVQQTDDDTAAGPALDLVQPFHLDLVQSLDADAVDDTFSDLSLAQPEEPVFPYGNITSVKKSKRPESGHTFSGLLHNGDGGGDGCGGYSGSEKRKAQGQQSEKPL